MLKNQPKILGAIITFGAISLTSTSFAGTQLPLKKGFYAPTSVPCNVDGSYRLYNQMLTYWPEDGGLNDSSDTRQIKKVTPSPTDWNKYTIKLKIFGGGQGLGADTWPTRTVKWQMTIPNDKHFSWSQIQLAQRHNDPARCCSVVILHRARSFGVVWSCQLDDNL